MAKKKEATEIITLQCGECKQRNYTTTKNRRTNTERLEIKKYCRFDKKHTSHKEVK
jgi:large subunit ribosomal protein L33